MGLPSFVWMRLLRVFSSIEPFLMNRTEPSHKRPLKPSAKTEPPSLGGLPGENGRSSGLVQMTGSSGLGREQRVRGAVGDLLNRVAVESVRPPWPLPRSMSVLPLPLRRSDSRYNRGCRDPEEQIPVGIFSMSFLLFSLSHGSFSLNCL